MYDFKKIKNSNKWQGFIFDPDSKKSTYNAKIWTDDDKTLHVRGYLFIFYRTQKWVRLDHKQLEYYLKKAAHDRKIHPSE